jgi:hypothetical protein
MKGDSIGRIVASRYDKKNTTSLYGGSRIKNTYTGRYRSTKIEDMVL